MLVLNLSPTGPSTSLSLQGNQLRPHPRLPGAQKAGIQASISTSPLSACCMPGPALGQWGRWRYENQERTESGHVLGNRGELSSTCEDSSLASKTKGELRPTFTKLLEA